MKASKTQDDTGYITVGNQQVAFAVVRSRKRKRTIAFRMERDATVRILAPASTSLNYLTKFLQSRAPWVAERLSERKKAPLACDFRQGSLFPYLGHHCTLVITQGMKEPASCRLLPHRILVHVPDDALSSQALAAEVRLEILLWLKKRAKAKFKQRLDHWAEKLGVTYKKLVVTDPEYRWGSCSVENIIRLNWRLMMAPLSVIDYVIVHELSHVPHKDHSPRFWNFVGTFMPDYKKRRQRLRQLERVLVS